MISVSRLAKPFGDHTLFRGADAAALEEGVEKLAVLDGQVEPAPRKAVSIAR